MFWRVEGRTVRRRTSVERGGAVPAFEEVGREVDMVEWVERWKLVG